MRKIKTTGNDLLDIALAIVIILALGSAVTGIVYYVKNHIIPPAVAAEVEWFPEYTIVWIGAEYDISKQPITCDADGYGWNGTVGARQSIFDYGPLRTNVHLQHHSCAFSGDNTDYNAVGFTLEMNMGKLFNLK